MRVKLAKQAENKQPHKYKLLITALVLGILAVIIGASFTGVCAISVGGEIIAYGENKKQVDKIINRLTSEKSQVLGQEVTVGKDLELKTTKSSKEPLNEQELYAVLAGKVDFVTRGVLVKIKGSPELQFKNRATADSFFQKLKERYRTGANCEVSIAEKTEIIEQEININELDTIERALQLAQQGKDKPIRHIVQENDTLWDLAVTYDTSVEELMRLNPETSENLQLGQEIITSGYAPLLTVISEFELTQEEKIPFETEYINDSSLPRGTSKTIRQGEPGIKKVTYRVTAQNGKITEKKIVTEDVIKEPQAGIVNRGTKFVLSFRGGGALVWPASGSVTSRLGPRWGRSHTGIDIDAGYGSQVWAAGPGRVVSAGWNGGYGQMVAISHGNNVVTRYAHLSSINVKAGQTVDSRQFIGRVGTSGNTTGPNLHFEVLINGAQKNPLNYL